LLTLLSTNEAASKLGISVQGVHYRIKTNKLKSIQKDGKTFVYVEIEEPTKPKQEETQHYSIEIIKVKDEQISLLKRALRWLTFQHKSEIKRLEENHNKLIDVFKSEVELLQKAYNEMQNLYKIEYKTPSINQVQAENEKKSDIISLQEFLILMKRYKKSNIQIKNILYDCIQSGDERFVYDSKNKKLVIYNDNFKDLV
jgi:hypothetical protein